MLNSEESNVMQIQCLDDEGYWLKHSYFLNMNSPTFCSMFKKILNDKNITNTYSTVRSVEYA